MLTISSSAATSRSARSAPATSNETIAPNALICARARSWPGSVGKPGIQDAIDALVGVQPARELRGRLVLADHPHGQRAHAAQRQVALHHAWDRAAQRPLTDQQVAPQVVARDDHAHQQVRVTAQVLGRGVQDRPGPPAQRLLEHRGGERVIHDRAHACLPGGGEHSRQVGDPQRRVGRRLQPQQVGLPQTGEDRVGVGDVDGGQPHVARSLELAQQRLGSRVGVVGVHHRGARLDQREQRCRRRLP